ncbi:MAG: TetR/AcrR family transcriptional regulator [Parvibaculum sp.]
MAAAAKHKDKLIGSAITLFRQKGYAATGLNEILAHSGAPKGSLYHYFPQGKEELGAIAVARAGAAVTATLQHLHDTASDAGQFLKAYSALLCDWIEKSDFREGCPIATTLLETAPQSERIAAAGREAFAEWIGLIASVYRRDGLSPRKATDRAAFAVSAIEGALILARVQKSTQPIRQVAKALSGG